MKRTLSSADRIHPPFGGNGSGTPPFCLRPLKQDITAESGIIPGLLFALRKALG
jgi:hypothetical protein